MSDFSNPDFFRKLVPRSSRIFSIFCSGLDAIDKSLFLHDDFYKDWASPKLFHIAPHDMTVLRRKVSPLIQKFNNDGLFKNMAEVFMFSDFDRLNMMKLGMYDPMIDLCLYKMEVKDEFYLKYKFEQTEIMNEIYFFSMRDRFSSKIRQDNYMKKIDLALEVCDVFNIKYLGSLIKRYQKLENSLFVDFLKKRQILHEMNDVCFFYCDDYLLKGNFSFYRDLNDVKCELKNMELVNFKNDKILNCFSLISLLKDYKLDFLEFNKHQIKTFLRNLDFNCNEPLLKEYVQKFSMTFTKDIYN